MLHARWLAVGAVAAAATTYMTPVSGQAERPRVDRFTIEVPAAVLRDLDERLARTRWPDQLPGTGWDYGADTAYLRELVDYWQNEYDWREQERALNRFGHFRATVDGTRIHFVHMKSRDPDAIPVLLLHGWATGTAPASVRMYYDFVREPLVPGRVERPVGMLMSTKDLFPPAPREFGERLLNVQHWVETDAGGHFLEWEEPELVARDLQIFFGSVAR